MPFRLFLLALILLLPQSAEAQLRLPHLISDGMVMQRGLPVPVWGWARPGADVRVTFGGKEYAARADAAGKWTVELPPMQAGGPHTMAVQAGSERAEVEDILVGDVWIASGQSNMEWTVANSNHAEREIAAANDRKIRHFKVPRTWAERPEEELAGGSWEAADPAHVGDFSAVAYFFARDLREHVDVPIGIINTSWGGSRIEPWMSAEALGLDENGLAARLQEEETRAERIRETLRSRMGGELPTKDAGLVDGRALWAAPDLVESGWQRIPVPSSWEQAGYEAMDGTAWYRTGFDLTAEEARAGVRLGLGVIDDSDVAWVNGQEVGGMKQSHDVARVYDVPPSALRAGRNVVAVRVEDTGAAGGILGTPDLLFVESGSKRKPLAGDWRFRPGAVRVTAEARRNHTPTLLYNKMVHPLLNYPIKGALWYQGESNAGGQDAHRYRELFADMIEDWRARWGVGDFPFLFVQLANYMAPSAEPAESDWAVLRESQTATLAVPNTAQAVIIDIGEADDIHPRNKQDVGKRLALAARKVAYGQDVVYSGPTYRGHERGNGRIYVDFDHVGGGLRAKGGPLKGFAVAGPDGRFVWANAAIEDDRVVVWSEQVPDPVSVRYAWADNPDTANLYNAEGLPASPFRTDAE